MKDSLHYLLMADHLLLQKSLLLYIKNTELTPGQPKVLDYLAYHDGAVQKEIAEACHIEPATITSVLLGMESKELIVRNNLNGNRRSLYVHLTDKGKSTAKQIEDYFDKIENKALQDFSMVEKEMLISLLKRLNDNMRKNGVGNNE